MHGPRDDETFLTPRERMLVINTPDPEPLRSGRDSHGPAGCAMAVMGKASAPGRTKTRLVPPLSAAQAADLNTAFLKDMIGNLLRAGREMPIAPYLAFGPAGSEPFFRSCLPADLPLIECSMPHFGDCLYRAVISLLERGHGAACVLNSDSPTLPTRLLVAAARALAQPEDGVVIGPSTDGGYYLLGLKRAHRRLFDDIEWSTPRVFAQTLQRAAESALSVTILEPWYDVDDAEGLARLRTELAAPSSGHYGAPCTRAALSHLNVLSGGACAAPAPVRADL